MYEVLAPNQPVEGSNESPEDGSSPVEHILTRADLSKLGIPLLRSLTIAAADTPGTTVWVGDHDSRLHIHPKLSARHSTDIYSIRKMLTDARQVSRARASGRPDGALGLLVVVLDD